MSAEGGDGPPPSGPEEQAEFNPTLITLTDSPFKDSPLKTPAPAITLGDPAVITLTDSPYKDSPLKTANQAVITLGDSPFKVDPPPNKIADPIMRLKGAAGVAMSPSKAKVTSAFTSVTCLMSPARNIVSVTAPGSPGMITSARSLPATSPSSPVVLSSAKTAVTAKSPAPTVMSTGTSSPVVSATSPGSAAALSPGTPVKAIVTAAATPTSGHRSRKEKLVLRSFSTEIDEVLMEPRIVTREEYFSSPSKRGSRTRRIASAPASALTPGSSPIHSDEGMCSPPLNPSSPASPHSAEKKTKTSSKHKEPKDPNTPKKQKGVKSPPSSKKASPALKVVTTIKVQNPSKGKGHTPLTFTSNPKKQKTLKTLIPTKRASSLKTPPAPGKKIKTTHKSQKVMKKHSIKKRVTIKPHKQGADLNRTSRHIQTVSILKQTPVITLPGSPEKNALVEHKPPPPKKQIKWQVKSRIFQMIRNVMNENENSSGGINVKEVDDHRSSFTLAELTSKFTDGAEGEEEYRRDLLHYAVGVACLEHLLSPGREVRLPKAYYVMIENLVGICSNGKKSGKHFLDYARLLVKQKRDELGMLMAEADEFCAAKKEIPGPTDDEKKKDVNFKPIFHVGSVIENDDEDKVSYPRVTPEEIECYEELLNEEDVFDCYPEEAVLGNIYLYLMQMDFKSLVEKRASDLSPNGESQTDDKRVTAVAFPLTFTDEQNQHGLFISDKEFQERLTNTPTDKENLLKDVKTRRLRNGKKVSLETIQLPGLKLVRREKVYKDKPRWGPVPPGGLRKIMLKKLKYSKPTRPLNPNAMRLRNGTDVEFVEMENDTILDPYVEVEVVDEPEFIPSVKPHSSGDKEAYSSRAMHANLRRIEDVGMDRSNVDMNKSEGNRKLIEEGKGVIRSRIHQLPRFNPVAMLQMSPQRNLSIEAGPSSRFYNTKPLKESTTADDTWSTSSSESNSFSNSFSSSTTTESSVLSQMLSPTRRPYSRRRHASICPPYDNNHCSFSGHFCAYPRAQASRFCIQHADEGATVNFERCKYVKGSRECGRYIPKSQSQSVFCDIHALAIAKARIKKIKGTKPADKTPLLLKHLRFNLDRAQGKIMEPDEQGGYQVRKELWFDEREALNNSSDSSDEETVVKDYLKHNFDDDSDVDDFEWGPPSEELDYELLKNAGYYTTDEVVKMHRSRLVKLKELYLREIDTVKRKYKIARKDYLRKTVALKKHKWNFTTDPKYISNEDGKLSEKYIRRQVKTAEATRALLNHRRTRGPRALLQMEALRQQKFMEDIYKRTNTKLPERKLAINETETERKHRARKLRRPIIKCSYGSTREDICNEQAMTLSKYCKKHIFEDKHQVLFKICGYHIGPDPDDVCKIPVLSELEKFGCQIHRLPVPLKDPPDSENRKSKAEEEIDKLMEELEDDDSFDYDSISDTEFDEEVLKEMEELVGDEAVDLEHFKETVDYLLKKGITETDSEESEDTDEEENIPTADGFNASPVKKELI